MGKIFCILGKSSTGKDTIYKKLLENKELNLKTIILYTTRPIRQGEVDGREYYFTNEEKMREYERSRKLIEVRGYHTKYGIWYYFTVQDGQVDIERWNYLIHATLESYQKLQDYYGKERLVPLYIEVEDGIRLERALKREQGQLEPKYAEMCRRFLADEKDFSEENIRNSKIQKRFQNIELKRCVEEIIEEIRSEIKKDYRGI